MTTAPVLRQAVIQGTVLTASLPQPSGSGGGVTGQVFGLAAADLADPGLTVVLTVQLQYHPGGPFESRPDDEFTWRGGQGQPLPSVSVVDPYYRRARWQVDVSRPVSLGVNAIFPD